LRTPPDRHTVALHSFVLPTQAALPTGGFFCVAGLAILICAGIRALWSLLRPDREVADRRARVEHDREVVRLGRVPGYKEG
jgi:hypothetical protein